MENMVDIVQQELNLVEQNILTDIFGGYTPEHFVYRYGLLKLNVAPKVQKLIDKFESFMKPLMDEHGYIDNASVQSFLNEEIIKLPEGKHRLIELYQQYQPYFLTIISTLKG